MRHAATGQQPLLSKFLLPAMGIEPWAFACQSDALTTWLTSIMMGSRRLDDDYEDVYNLMRSFIDFNCHADEHDTLGMLNS